MRRLFILLFVLVTAAVFALSVPGDLWAQGDSTISTTVIDAGSFITVKETVVGDVLSLYRIRGDRIVLVDTVVNTNDRGSSDTSFPKRFVIHVDVENR